MATTEPSPCALNPIGLSPQPWAQVQHDLGLPELASGAEAERTALEMLRLYQTYGWLAAGADPKDRGPGDQLVPLAAATLMAARHLEPSRPAVLRRMLQVRSAALEPEP